MRGIRGKLHVIGRRIDADTAPLRFETGTPNSESGFIASYLIFPTPGCWEVTAQVGDQVDSKLHSLRGLRRSVTARSGAAKRA